MFEQDAALFRQVSVDHLTVRMSRSRNKRLLWPAPAKETMASRCSCRSPVGPNALIGDSLTWGNEGMPVLLQPCTPNRAPCHFVPSTAPSNSRRLGVLRTGGTSSNAQAPRNERCGPIPAAVCWAQHPTSPFTALLMDLRVVRAQARCPRCSSVCGCTTLAVLRSGPRVLLTQDSGDQITDLSRFPQVKSFQK